MTDAEGAADAPGPAGPAPSAVLRGLLRRSHGELTRGDAIVIVGLFLAAVLAFSAAAIAVAVALGHPLLAGQIPGGGKSGLDALWHLLTAFVLVLPLRNRLAAVLAPALSLGIDIDHLFGSVFPYVVGREAHDVFFLVLVSLFVAALEGRSAGLLTAGAVVTHIGVDGGVFPFFAPATLTLYPLDYPVEVALVALAAVLFFLAYRSPRDLLRPRTGLPVAGAVAVIAVAMIFFPYLFTFNTF